MAEFKDRFKQLRKQRKMTQVEIANIFGKTESLIRKYENGTAYPTALMIIDLSYFFNVSTDYLLGIPECEVKKNSLENYSIDELLDEVKRRCKS